MIKKDKQLIMKCCNCNKKHIQSHSNCCWVTCTCGVTICGRCGSDNIEEDETINREEDDNQYWCCRKCFDCGLVGCGMCV